jgi:hypothetical protein
MFSNNDSDSAMCQNKGVIQVLPAPQAPSCLFFSQDMIESFAIPPHIEKESQTRKLYQRVLML